MSKASMTARRLRAMPRGATLLLVACLVFPAAAWAQSEEGSVDPTCGSTEPGPVQEPGPGDGVPDPAGRIAYAVAGRYDELFGPIGTQLFAIDPDGSDHVLLLDCEVIRPQWSPDGSRIAFTLGMQDGSWQVATMAADGSDLRVLTSGPGIHEIPTWSPDGTWLAYDFAPTQDPADPAFRATLWRIDADGTDAAPLWEADTFDVEPRLSPDGSRVAFQRLHPERDYASQFIVRDLASGEERAPTPLGFPLEHPEWAPDGRSLVGNASDWAPTTGTIYTIDPEAVEAEPTVMHDPASGWRGVKPVFSPHGDRLVVVCNNVSAPQDDICLMDADGTLTPLVADPDVHENHPTWGVAASD